jgi:hypothetical protein
MWPGFLAKLRESFSLDPNPSVQPRFSQQTPVVSEACRGHSITLKRMPITCPGVAAGIGSALSRAEETQTSNLRFSAARADQQLADHPHREWDGLFFLF